MYKQNYVLIKQNIKRVLLTSLALVFCFCLLGTQQGALGRGGGGAIPAPRMANNGNAYAGVQAGNGSEDRVINTPGHAMEWATTGRSHHHQRPGAYAETPGEGGRRPSSSNHAAMMGFAAAHRGHRPAASALTGRGDEGSLSSSSAPSSASSASNKRPLLGAAAAGVQACEEGRDSAGKARGAKKIMSGSSSGSNSNDSSNSSSSSAALQQQKQNPYGSPHLSARGGFSHSAPLPQSSRHAAAVAAVGGRSGGGGRGRGSTHEQPHLNTTGIYIGLIIPFVFSWRLCTPRIT